MSDFLFKLTWDILNQKDLGLSFIYQRHTTAEGRDVRYHISSSIWSGLNRIKEAMDSGKKFKGLLLDRELVGLYYCRSN